MSSEVLSSIPIYRKVMMCLVEKMDTLDKLCSDISYSAVGRESTVNELTIYINKVSLNRNTHKTRLHIEQLMKM